MAGKFAGLCKMNSLLLLLHLVPCVLNKTAGLSPSRPSGGSRVGLQPATGGMQRSEGRYMPHVPGIAGDHRQ